MDRMPHDHPMQNPPPLAGLDPADLLRQGAADDTLVDGASSAFNPPPIEELAKIFPQFEILELIGQGGMGAVYKVRQKDLDRIVALKILPPGIGQSPEFSNRFTREARALAKLNHPGIVTIHEFGQQDGLYFILMEFVDGVNLAQLMKTGRVSPREALAIVPQICDALQYAHDQGVVHRDIKPENLLLDRQGRVKVADFGISKVVAAVCPENVAAVCDRRADATLAGKIIGTPQYMAPEQIEHPSDVDHRADIYALGVVFYQMLTGELPGKDLQAPSRKLQIDVRLDEIVLKALEKKPEQRYQQASVMKTRLETVVSDKGSAAVPTTSLGVLSSDKRETSAPLDSRFSRTAIVGACWVPLFLLVMFAWFVVHKEATSPYAGKEAADTSFIEMIMIILMPLGLTAPFGSTILGWFAVSQIRRSAGKLHGLWLAVFDGLIFPLLVMIGLFGCFWNWVFFDWLPKTIIGVQAQTAFEIWFVNNLYLLTVLATVMSSLVAGFHIVRKAWRAVNAEKTAALNNSSPDEGAKKSRAIVIGCGALFLIGIVVVVLGFVMPLIVGNRSKQSHERFMEASLQEFAAAAARSKRTEAELEEKTHMETIARQWLAKVDAGEYAASWKESAEFFQKAITSEAWSDALTKFRKPLGEVKSRKLLDAKNAQSLPGAPDGEYVVMQFETSFSAKQKAVETVTFMKQADGSWKAAGYFIR